MTAHGCGLDNFRLRKVKIDGTGYVQFYTICAKCQNTSRYCDTESKAILAWLDNEVPFSFIPTGETILSERRWK